MATYIAFFCGMGIVGSGLVLLVQERIQQTVFSIFYPIVLFGLLVFMWRVSDPPELFSDFSQAYYPAGQAIVQDVSRLYDRLPGCEESAICGFVNIPVVAFLFAPLSLLSLERAQVAFALLSWGCIAASLYYLVVLTAATGWRRWAIATLFVVNGPLLYSVREGNLTHVVLLLIVLTFVCVERNAEVWAGVFVACAVVIKLPLGLLGAYFVFKGRWRVAFGLVLTLLAFIGTSLLSAGWESHVTWYRESILPFASKSLAAFNVQSVDGFLLRLRAGSPLYDWTPVPVDGSLRLARTVLVGLFLVMSGILLRGSAVGDSKNVHYLDLCAVLCLALILSPISWTHYYLFLLVPFCLYVGGRLPVQQSRNWSLGMVTCMLLVSPPVMFVNPSWGGITGKIFISHYVFGAVLLWALLCLARWRNRAPSLCRVHKPRASEQAAACPHCRSWPYQSSAPGDQRAGSDARKEKSEYPAVR